MVYTCLGQQNQPTGSKPRSFRLRMQESSEVRGSVLHNITPSRHYNSHRRRLLRPQPQDIHTVPNCQDVNFEAALQSHGWSGHARSPGRASLQSRLLYMARGGRSRMGLSDGRIENTKARVMSDHRLNVGWTIIYSRYEAAVGSEPHFGVCLSAVVTSTFVQNLIVENSDILQEDYLDELKRQERQHLLMLGDMRVVPAGLECIFLLTDTSAMTRTRSLAERKTISMQEDTICGVREGKR
ncbi:hypothetical protein PROFUN_13077 [Planoprotostelium fungivorum]|uniref:Uncharacterized protein n=1 Tax=Planoprotostelium fungivorum TaxID=1890364 RepID=A0A2P6N5H6_9EUKA|nr:hypothetical protein PROFUN_13077 [Planoprotostelium fungivorum]